MRPDTPPARLLRILDDDPVDLAGAAFLIAEIEYPRLDAMAGLATIDALAARAGDVFDAHRAHAIGDRIDALNQVVFEEAGFAGNQTDYGDYRNSLLNVVIERRLGIPITLALVYIEVARRAGVEIAGVAFPGHFLLSAGPDDDRSRYILDPFDAGRRLDQDACQALLAGQFGDTAELQPLMLRACTPRQFIARLLNNLKRAYVEHRSFHQAWRVADLLVAVDPSMASERRDRGLLAYHLDDFRSALRDLEDYLSASAAANPDADAERDQLWEHVRALRRRVAGLN